jgi:hypothetical protein
MEPDLGYIQHIGDVNNLYLSNQFYIQMLYIIRTTNNRYIWDQNLCNRNTSFVSSIQSEQFQPC